MSNFRDERLYLDVRACFLNHKKAADILSFFQNVIFCQMIDELVVNYSFICILF